MALAAFLRIRRGLLFIRPYSSQMSSQESTSLADEEVTEAEIPMVPKRRDPHAVLKALASTIEPVEREIFRGIGPADPLYPATNQLKMEYVKYNEAGRRAARYIMYKWPNTFRFKRLDSDPIHFEKKPLERNITKQRPYKAIWIYNKMKENGEQVSLETRNKLLALVAYHGLGSSWAAEADAKDVTHFDGDMNWWPRKNTDDSSPAEQDQGQDLIPEEKLSKTKIKDGVKLWRLDNTAEQLFKEMEEKDGATYEALIQGLVKNKNFRRAFEIFDEMRNEGFQAHTQTYNLLLSSLNEGKPLNSWTKALHILKHMSAEPLAKPTSGTFDLLLQLASSSRSSAEATGHVMREMFHAGVKPTLSTFYWLNETYSFQGGGCVMNEIMDYMEKNPDIMRIQDSHCHMFFNRAMAMCRSIGDPAMGMRLQRLFVTAGNHGLIDSMYYYIAYFLLLRIHPENIDDLIREYRALVPLRLLPYEWIYGQMFKGASKAARLDFILELWEDMMKYNIKIKRVDTIDHFSEAVWRTNPSIEDAAMCIQYIEKGIEILAAHALEYDRPSPIIVNNLVKLASVTQDKDKIWKYYEMLDKMEAYPTFQTLSEMLKAYYGSSDKETVTHILEEMVKQGMFLRHEYLQDVCRSSDIGEDVRGRLNSRFAENRRGKEEMIY